MHDLNDHVMNLLHNTGTLPGCKIFGGELVLEGQLLTQTENINPSD